ncbi:hypothetical protein Nepgr_005043 [Nepenthes gracilis]|uniref:Uncharacterized protein n=1 Tax=Nepenthes gracilis TaxID=150966 RepID=A0AAD3S2Y3_NEPGR|nr:hypothetical protein Nepgr_005043 [Nepenthes gracilis]
MSRAKELKSTSGVQDRRIWGIAIVESLFSSQAFMFHFLVRNSCFRSSKDHRSAGFYSMSRHLPGKPWTVDWGNSLNVHPRIAGVKPTYSG